MTEIVDGFTVSPGALQSSVILHVPHSSRVIPADARAGILLSDAALQSELDLMTDAHTDIIAGRAAARVVSRPWLFLNRLSRLVVDPERFPDEREAMRAVGMGAVYTRTASGEVLREDAPELVAQWFEPYADALSALVDERLDAAGQATIIDVHSYPSHRLSYEIGAARRPAICLGVDAGHTPRWLVEAARAAFAGCGDIEENSPFAGCYVPLAHYGRDARVNGIMIEIRRDVYMEEPGGAWTRGLDIVSDALASLIDGVGQQEERILAELWEAYRMTEFCASVDGTDLHIRPDATTVSLDRVLANRGVATWAYITAWNPRSRTLSREENDARHGQLKRDVLERGFEMFEGEGRPLRGDWTPERSLLVVGIAEPDAVSLGRKFGQSAVVVGRIEQRAKLVPCFPD